MDRGSAKTVAMLGTAQTLAWASSYYLPAILAGPMARDLGLSTPTVFLAFSLAMVVAAFVGPRSGDAIDRLGGRPVLAITSLIFAAGLTGLAFSTTPWMLFASWAIVGIGMGSGLYEAAFAALVRLYGQDARSTITGITLVAGFASTVGWPVSTYLEAHYGWRNACLVWAALHVVLGLPLNLLLPRATKEVPTAPALTPLSDLDPEATRKQDTSMRTATFLLSFVFAATWFTSTAMAAHLPRLLVGAGATMAAAITAGALVGPAQVAARVLEYTFLRRMHPLLSARIATALHPAGAMILLIAGGITAPLFTVLHGAGNGILTIAKGTLPLVLFGPEGYGRRQGVLTVPTRIAQASAPWLFGLCLDEWGTAAVWVTSGLSLLSLIALMRLPMAAGEVSAEPVPETTGR